MPSEHLEAAIEHLDAASNRMEMQQEPERILGPMLDAINALCAWAQVQDRRSE